MTILTARTDTSTILQIGEGLTLTGPGTGWVYPINDDGTPGAPVLLYNGTETTYGPYNATRRLKVSCFTQTITTTVVKTAGGSAAPTAKTATATGPGVVAMATRLLGSTSLFALATGSNSNLTIASSTGAVSATNAIGAGVSQKAIIRETDGDVSVEYPLTITGAAVVTPTPTPSPSVAFVTPSPKILSNAPPGTFVSALTGVPSGVTPSVTPNDGRFAIAGDATNGWKVVVGLSAISAGSVNLGVSATGATSATAPLTVVQFLGYHRLVSWGQSNEIGRNGPIDAVLDAPDYRIYNYGFDSQTVTQAVLQLDYQDETPNTVGPIMAFAKAYIAAGNLPEGYALLTVTVARGNTAFGTGFWDAGGSGDTAAIARMNAAAALADGIWIAASGTLGEGDRTQTQTYFATKIDALITRWRANVTGASSMPFLMGGLLVGGAQTAAPIVAALQDLPNRMAFTAYISSEGLTGGTDNIHLDAPSQRTSGQRRYDGLAVAKANVGSPKVGISGAQSKDEGNSGATLFTYTVTRTITTGAVSVPWTFAAGSTSADDFTSGYPTGGTVEMADGVPTGTITISVNGDTTVEPSETFTVSITAPNGYSLASNSSATGTIVNDDVSAGGLNATFTGADNTTAASYITDSGHTTNQTTGVSQIRNNALAGTTVPSEGTFNYSPPSINQTIKWRTIVNTKAGNCYIRYRVVDAANYYYAGCGSNGSFHTLASFVGSQANNFAGATTATPAFVAGDVLDYELTITGPNGSEVHTLKVSVNGAAAVQVFSGSPTAAVQTALAAPGLIGWRQSSAASSATVGCQLDNITATA